MLLCLLLNIIRNAYNIMYNLSVQCMHIIDTIGIQYIVYNQS